MSVRRKARLLQPRDLHGRSLAARALDREFVPARQREGERLARRERRVLPERRLRWGGRERERRGVDLRCLRNAAVRFFSGEA